ncbi:chorismate-binding protein [Allomuricauda sp. F6463D]|uniref:chorismate-binding protein n=1 Tax=Allomuricauda sp. F6463D TaxID=2926409 RepID=UPI001FF5F79D|nr:chorismate-binding protein [Muricauda sp. F6463D]MCK0159398.1 chorismate-binding protein [Muricauda sp. F6463D]
MHYPENKELQEVYERVESCMQSGLPFVIYRKPNDNELFAVFQSTDELVVTIDFIERGFVFAPFDRTNEAVLIQPDEVWKAVFNYKDSNTTNFDSTDESGKEAHVNLVKKGIKEIERGNLKKVVLSRKIDLPFTKAPVKIFNTLLHKYPNAFGYLFHHPKIGMWCGATPETLVEINNRELSTMSLAATLPYIKSKEPKWGNKEIEEQQMVSQYIGDKLAPTMERLEIDEAESVRAGNLWHLRSEISGTMLQNIEIKEVINALHPTPAVCGIPTEAAKQFIQQNETYQRTFYTGFLGELNLWEQGAASLFVNLRCMELQNGKASIFVGGGITKASNPESEWIETQNKSKTMLGTL